MLTKNELAKSVILNSFDLFSMDEFNLEFLHKAGTIEILAADHLGLIPEDSQFKKMTDNSAVLFLYPGEKRADGSKIEPKTLTFKEVMNSLPE